MTVWREVVVDKIQSGLCLTLMRRDHVYPDPWLGRRGSKGIVVGVLYLWSSFLGSEMGYRHIPRYPILDYKSQ